MEIGLENRYDSAKVVYFKNTCSFQIQVQPLVNGPRTLPGPLSTLLFCFSVQFDP